MVKKYAKWCKSIKNHYKLIAYNDESMRTLSIFLGDGLNPKSYIEFLDNKQESEFSGNLSTLEKNGAQVTVTLFDDFFSDLKPFSTTLDNLKKIIIEWNRFEDLGVEQIEITLIDNQVVIS